MFGRNLKRHREKSNMTQRQLAEKLGVAQSMVAQMERGTKNPSPQMLNDLSDIFNCTVDELIKGQATA